MKKATSKRDRKYGKKNEDDIKVTKETKERVVRIMVDYGMIRKFNTQQEADAFMNTTNKESDKKGMPRTSFVII